ncbi:hypothetical protein ACFL0J_08430 [Candidatus Neomarinimicrobiota bacterium]
MKIYFYLIFVLVLNYATLTAQNNEQKNVEISIGVVSMYDDFDYRTIDSDFYLESGVNVRNLGGWFHNFPGYRVEFSIPSKINYLYYYTGFTFHRGGKNFSRSDNNAYDFNISGETTLFGGGIYGGLSLKSGKEYFGILSKIGIGYFAYQYNREMDIYPYYEENSRIVKAISSSSIGGIFDFGFYIGSEKIKLNPSFHSIITGGKKLTIAAPGGSLIIIYKL